MKRALSFVTCLLVAGLSSSSSARPAAPALPALQSLLSGRRAIPQTPISKRYGATTFEAKVELVSVRDDAAAQSLAQTEIKQTLESRHNYGSQLAPIGPWSYLGTDTHVTVKTGYEEAEIKKYLLSLLKGETRVQAARILGDEDNSYSYLWFQAYDIGAELIGSELIIIQSAFEPKALVIRLEYDAG